ncbi:NAD-dependent protein deacylase SRT2-like [Eucalyptus grandis]|uniref:NAD-dependent protein deacylase SRT2-like n=1 Tax=Eucalyptus grandis TaxID=71139 RepID=UPI00192EC42B|nr:NAD-dependent protein deacylase SRT2-like [Eucalyptus grandis]
MLGEALCDYNKVSNLCVRTGRVIFARSVRINACISVPGVSSGNPAKAPPKFSRDKKMVPDSDPPSLKDTDSLHRFFESKSALEFLFFFFFCPLPAMTSYFYLCSQGSCSMTKFMFAHLCLSKLACGTKLVVLTGAGMSTEYGIPDYRSPNGAYSADYRPITHQACRRYWARSYAGWRSFIAAQLSAAHYALASLEKAGQIDFMITQNVDRQELWYEAEA